MVEEQAKKESCVKQAASNDFMLHSKDSEPIKFSVL
jgi:hypothetical protein